MTILTLRAIVKPDAKNIEKDLNDDNSDFRLRLNTHLLTKGIAGYSGLHKETYSSSPDLPQHSRALVIEVMG